MKCQKCQFPNLKGSTFCSACGAQLANSEDNSINKHTLPANSEITINVVEKAKPKKIGCFGVFGVFILVGLIFSAIAGNNNDESSSESNQAQTNRYCAMLTKNLTEAIEYMGNAGTKYTAEDVSRVLEKTGNALVSGFDQKMAGSVERLGWIQDAGEQLLRIRVAITDGGDVTEAAEVFKAKYALIMESCK